MPSRTKPRPAVGPLTESEVLRIADTIKMAAEPVRVRMILLLDESESNVSGIQDATGAHQTIVSHHLKLMLMLGLVRKLRAGKGVVYSLTDTGKSLAHAIRSLASRPDVTP